MACSVVPGTQLTGFARCANPAGKAFPACNKASSRLSALACSRTSFLSGKRGLPLLPSLPSNTQGSSYLRKLHARSDLRDDGQEQGLVSQRSTRTNAAPVDRSPTIEMPSSLAPSPEGTCDPLCSVDEMSTDDFVDSYKPREDLFKALVIALAAFLGAAVINHEWVAANQDAALIFCFILGYLGIIFEESLAFNKSGVGLLMAVALWTLRSVATGSPETTAMELREQVSEVSEIVYFLMGAMTIVEIVDAHQGFKLVTDSITTRSPKSLLWVVGGITFFLSSILDNLTSTIVMVSLLRKLVPDPERRRFMGAVVVIAANAGGAWTPIGDVTTTMLWINGQISTLPTMRDLFLPSVVSLAVPLALMTFTAGLEDRPVRAVETLATEQMAPRGRLVFAVGVGALLFVPFFKAVTGLPPYLGMLMGLGLLWLLTDAIHYGEAPDRQRLKVPQALSRIDTQGVLFFLGILLSVACLDSAGVLEQLAVFLDDNVPNVQLVAGVIGLASAVIDNVPLVAATMGMYSTTVFPMDDQLWQLIAYCAGTGGSILIIGSAAGVAFMGMEKADFLWYTKRVSLYALAGYVAGIGVYLVTVPAPPASLSTVVASVASPELIDVASSVAAPLATIATAAAPSTAAYADAASPLLGSAIPDTLGLLSAHLPSTVVSAAEACLSTATAVNAHAVEILTSLGTWVPLLQ